MGLYKPKVKQVYLTGDLHGCFSAIDYWIKNNEITNSALIVCGDVGIGFNKTEYYASIVDMMVKVLKKYNDYVYFMRGNHDNPAYFNDKAIRHKRLKAISDYSVIQFNDVKIMCVGGAVSVDRKWRQERDAVVRQKCKQFGSSLPSTTWWPDEMPVYDENLIQTDADVMVSHTCPEGCFPNTKTGMESWLEGDIKLYDDIKAERHVMTQIWDKLPKVTKWYYGHFHAHNVETIRNVTFTCLDMCRNNILDVVQL